MKKITINLFMSLFLATLLISCNNNTQNSDVTIENETNTIRVDSVLEKTEEVSEIIIEEKIDFSKFEHFATILTKNELIEQFGESKLIDGIVTYAEGTVEMNITTLNTEDYSIRYVWKEGSDSTDHIEADYKLYNKDFEEIGIQKVFSEEGLYTGMILSELKKWNGTDFKFSGFGWDYAGGIFNDENSKISKSPIQISLDLLDFEGANFAIGDVELNSNDSRLDSLNIVVSQLVLYINKE